MLILNERDMNHPAAGGAELHVFEIFSRLASRGYDVRVISELFEGAAEREEVMGVRVERVGRVPFYYAAAAAACRRATAANEVDVVVECLNKLPFLSPMYSAAPVLGLSHHLFGTTAFQQVPFPIAVAVWAAEKAIPSVFRGHPFITISDSSKSDLVARGVDEDRVSVSLCGIRAPEVEARLDVPRPMRVVYLGRLAHYKRVDVMLRALAELRPRFPDLEVVIIGRGPAQPKLEQLAGEVGLAECTRFTGFVSDAERDELVAGARVCVCPSEKEGWGLTVIEANAVGTPVVAADAPGLRDSVRHEETGYLVRTGDVDGFAERIGSLLEEEASWRRMAEAALEWSSHFDWDVAADEMAVALAGARQAGAVASSATKGSAP
ncbi:MAG: glycosyltransferase family 4 protein [Myxococcota bacterium]|nr:glycosyltransferase family 4 protein [Myxococcota bacterium]